MIPIVISVTPYEMSVVKGCALLLGHTGATVFLKKCKKIPHFCFGDKVNIQACFN